MDGFFFLSSERRRERTNSASSLVSYMFGEGGGELRSAGVGCCGGWRFQGRGFEQASGSHQLKLIYTPAK